jgi:hypothetical protein
MIAPMTGTPGSFGFSAACSGFPSSFTPPVGGPGGPGRNAGVPLTNLSAGAGGTGAAGTVGASAGNAGAVRVYWN